MGGISGYFNKLGLVGISLLAVVGACTMAATVLHGGTGGGDLSGFGGSDSAVPCVDSTATKVTSSRPVDIIFVIDDSGSMTEELAGISKSINEHFADVMDKAGLDYRVIMIVLHGQPDSLYHNQLCIEAPLSKIPKGGCAKIGDNPPGINPGKFYHYSYDIDSNNSLCAILDTLNASNNRPDTFGLAPGGWIKWLRKSAFKVFIEVTDDMPACIWYPDETMNGKKNFNDYSSAFGGQVIAIEWDKALMKLSPEQFGTKDKRNYVFFSVNGLLEKPGALDDDTGLPIDPNGKSDDFFTPSEGVVDDVCSTAVEAGQGYQWLSKITGGLRFPVCQAAEFDMVFEKLASSIDSITSTMCTVEIPTGGSEGAIDISTLQIDVIDGNGNLKKMHAVGGSAFCTGASDEFYYDIETNIVSLCPNACSEAKSTAKNIKITAGCIPETH
jgi:hypothetical protein